MGIRKEHNYKILKIWQLGIEIIDDVFRLMRNLAYILKLVDVQCLYLVILPKTHQEQTNLFCHFIVISLGSSFELKTQLYHTRTINID